MTKSENRTIRVKAFDATNVKNWGEDEFPSSYVSVENVRRTQLNLEVVYVIMVFRLVEGGFLVDVEL